MVFAVTGTGRVSQGIIEVLEMLPHENVSPDNLVEYLEKHKDEKSCTKKIVICTFVAKDLVRLKNPAPDGGAFDKSHYYKNPNLYESKFSDFLPYISWLVNGIYWEAKYPRVLSIDDLHQAQKNGKNKLMGVCDISADYEGSIEFTNRFTSIEEPFLVWDAIKNEFREKID